MTRIAYVNCDHGIALGAAKGATVHIVELIRALAAEGARLHLLSARVDSRPTGLDGVGIDSLPEVPATPAGGRAGKEAAHRERAARMFDHLVALHRRQPFDVIYERHSLWSDAGVRAGRHLGIPVLVEVNAPLVDEQMAWRSLADEDAARRIEHSVQQHADHLFVVSNALRDRLAAQGVPDSRISVLGNGVDPVRFTPCSEPRKGPATTIGFTGSLKHWHGIRELMQAFACVHQERPESRLLIVGDGPKREWLEGFAEGAGLADAVTVTGWVTHDTLPGLIERMDIATAPYPGADDFYFSPLKLFEYMAMARPIVASRIGQVAEVLEHDRNAWLTEPGSSRALAQALLHLMDDDALRRRLGTAARASSAGHTWQRNARHVLEVASRLTRGLAA
jgi:glycosyltransferase involved in cell wall biosynthesis